MNKYIPIHEYAKKMNTTPQNVYRWIREGKFKEGEFKVEVIQVKRMRILENAQK